MGNKHGPDRVDAMMHRIGDAWRMDFRRQRDQRLLLEKKKLHLAKLKELRNLYIEALTLL
jgi:hypothetical protein